MTAHIFITCIVLVIFFIIQKITLSKPTGISFQTLLLIPVILIILPLSFQGITVIADILFVKSTDNLLWFSFLFLPIWLLSVYYTIKNKKKEVLLLNKIWFVYMCIALLAAYICALTTSHYESGPTPELTSSNFLISYFIGINVTVCFTLTTQIYLLFKCNWKCKATWLKSLATLLMLIIYIAIFYSNFS